MLTPNYDAFEPGDKVGRTFVWNEPDSPGEVSNSSSNASSYLFTRSALRTPIKASKRPSTPLPASNLTPRDITPRFLTGQILPGGRGPASRRGSNRSENSLFQPRRFVFEDIDETAQEEEPTGLFSPGEVDENRNSLGFTPSSSSTDTPSLSSSMLGLGLRQKTKTFILDDDSVQISEDGTSKRSQSVESIHLNDPRSPLLTSREAQKLCLGKSAKHKHGVGAVKGMLLCHCNCSRLRRSRNRVGCLPDPYEEL